eukprot:jgi/Botrbrau1/6736/Bobra.0324s0022.1
MLYQTFLNCMNLHMDLFKHGHAKGEPSKARSPLSPTKSSWRDNPLVKFLEEGLEPKEHGPTACCSSARQAGGGDGGPPARATAAAARRKALGDSWDKDLDKPWFHVMPREGWLNDPNGPIFHKGRYHIFYQHISGSSEWEWRMSWGHASSPDLVKWEHEPIALSPTPGGLDASGCWSGTTAVDLDGTPVMLYTGVRLRTNPDCGPLPHEALDLGLPMIESQLYATCDKEEERLTGWVKGEEACIPHPPEGWALEGWRDPYIIQRGDSGLPWRLILAAA